jgi:hypothetical protein
MAFDLDQELQTAVKSYEDRYGTRDTRFSFQPVSFHSHPYAQTLVDDTSFTLHVKLDQAARGNDIRLRYQIWHEAVHCLAPVRSMETLWFEEGLATYSCLYGPHMTREYRRLCIKGMKPFPAWYDPYQAFKKLKATDEQIATVHARAPERKFDLIKPELIVDVFGADPTLASSLCNRLGTSREAKVTQ